MSDNSTELRLGPIRLVQGDVTVQAVDAIVNAANRHLAAGGGVCGAIHRAGGPRVTAACEALSGCETGDAVATEAGDLPAQWVIHAVGPMWRGGEHGEAGLLARAYRRAVAVANELGCRSLAFPALSTGIYGYPLEQAARLALMALHEASETHPRIEDIRMVLFDAASFGVFAEALREFASGRRFAD